MFISRRRKTTPGNATRDSVRPGSRVSESRSRTSQVGERYREDRDIWTDYNDRQKFEHDLINRKTTWSLTAQTILLTAYGLTFTADIPNKVRLAIASLGLAVATSILVGILALIRSKYLSFKMYQKFYRKTCMYQLPQPLKRLDWGVRTSNTWLTLVPDMLLPVIFAAVWTAFLI
jgi:hypothetical protein